MVRLPIACLAEVFSQILLLLLFLPFKQMRCTFHIGKREIGPAPRSQVLECSKMRQKCRMDEEGAEWGGPEARGSGEQSPPPRGRNLNKMIISKHLIIILWAQFGAPNYQYLIPCPTLHRTTDHLGSSDGSPFSIS